ncbi:hypothetical protein RclHR1_15910006 [Rhizophagus clarus]|uniref:Glutathione S-transferase n=1 Tax=Rhizophagus clarus TaxID=94130 RepID=A0A2Z6R959_9GLOM|nr:hypothetical protein RclHR1_15910006 [Rhizophagus clarus]GES86096.1 glutathione S-transferase [Rhizophagus clarus]
MNSHDITLYTDGTQNGVKGSIILEELGIPYNVKHVSLEKKEHKEPWFLKINPCGKIPAITDHSKEDFHVFESAAIAIYLCENYDPEEKLLPKDFKLKSQVIQWVMFEASNLAPAHGQANYFVRYTPEKIPHVIKAVTDLVKGYYSILNKALEGKEYLVTDRFTMADAMCYPWVRSHFFSGIESIDEFTNLTAWVARIDERPATQRGLNVPFPDRMKVFRENPEKLEEFEKLIQSIFFANRNK